MSVRAAIDDAQRHGLLHLSEQRLESVPRAVFLSAALTATLVRLDLSANLLTTLPETVASLARLETLWVHDNPRLASLPSALAQCAQLRVIDARATALASLPCELARLTRLVVLDIGATPLETAWVAKGHLPPPPSTPWAQSAQRDQCVRVLHRLATKDARATIKRELYDELHDHVYRIERRDTAAADSLRRAIQRVAKRFPVTDELRSVIRNAERLFPSLAAGAPSSALPVALDALDPVAFRAAFDALATATERAKRAADLELKLRALYFDRIDPMRVPSLVQSIYAAIPALSDLDFLLRHATALFPSDPQAVDGQEVARRVTALQQELARERDAAIDKLRVAVKAIYSDTEPDAVTQLVLDVAARFKNTTDLRSLVADAATLFPSEFLNANASDVRAAFRQHKHAALGTK